MHINTSTRWRALLAAAVFGLSATWAQAQTLKVDPADDPAPAQGQQAAPAAQGGIKGQNIFEIRPDVSLVEESAEAIAARRKRVTLAALGH